MKARFRPLCLILLLVLAGCAASPPLQATVTETPIAASTTDAVTATTATSSTQTATTPSRVKILDYQNLGNKSKQVLREAIENGSATVTQPPGPVSPDKEGWYVRHQGELYKLSWEPLGLRGRYQLRDATMMNASAIDGTTAVVKYQTLSAHARQIFDTTRGGGETKTYDENTFPKQFLNNRYVKYQGEYYELRVVVGDSIIYRLSLREV